MATISYDIRQRLVNDGKYYAVEWKLFNDGDTRWWNTGQRIPKDFVEFRKKGQKGMGKHFKITNKSQKNFWDGEEIKMCERVNKITYGNRHMSAKAIVEKLKKEEETKNLDFLAFCYNWIESIKEQKRGWRSYQTAVNAFRKFVKKDKFDVQDFDSKVMFEFVESLRTSPYCQKVYSGKIATLYEAMRTKYNNYDRNDIIIFDRLVNWRKTKNKIKVPLPDKRDKTLTADNIRQIANAQFEPFELKSQKIMIEAREVFLLSFCLMAINLQDLWTMPASCFEKSSETIILNRSKTGVYTEIVVPKQIKAIFLKYRDKKMKYLFDFSYRSNYNENDCYRRRINLGLKRLSNKLGIKKFTFGASRQTVADIARRQLVINGETVNKMLQHTSPYKILDDHYAEDTYTDINEANEKLMSYLFGDKEINTFDN